MPRFRATVSRIEGKICGMSHATDGQPKRIQLARTKGWHKPEGAIVVARPRYWGNPYRIGETVGAVFERSSALWSWGGLRYFSDEHHLTRQETVDAFYQWIQLAVGRSGFVRREEARVEIAGRDLACWCSLDEPCHADVLLEIANGRR